MLGINKSLYLGWIIGGTLAGILMFCVGVLGTYVLITGSYVSDITVWMAVSILILLLGLALIAMNIVFSCRLLYKAWQAIQNGQTRTTPEKAVGFIFIPGFNFYWYFIAYWAFAKDYNLYLQHKSINLPTLPEKLFLFYPILLLLALIPYIGFFIGIASLIIFIIISSKTIDAVNNLYHARNATV